MEDMTVGQMDAQGRCRSTASFNTSSVLGGLEACLQRACGPRCSGSSRRLRKRCPMASTTARSAASVAFGKILVTSSRPTNLRWQKEKREMPYEILKKAVM